MTAAIASIWAVAYADWLSPGWLTFGIPKSISEPFTTQTTYDLGCSVRRSALTIGTRSIEAKTPDWLEVWRWDLNPLDGKNEQSSSCTKGRVE